MKKFPNIFSILFFLLYALQVIGQDFSFKKYTPNNGLSQHQVMDVFQDSKGFIWAATKNGINRFDGKSFVVFKDRDQGIIDPYVKDLGEDEEGNIWACSSKGLVKYDGNTFKTFFFQTDDLLREMALVSSEKAFVCKSSKLEVFEFSNESYQRIKAFDTILNPSHTLLQIKYDELYDRTLFLVKNKGVYSLKEETMELFFRSDHFMASFISSTDSVVYFNNYDSNDPATYKVEQKVKRVDVLENRAQRYHVKNSAGEIYFAKNSEIFRSVNDRNVKLGANFNRINDLMFDAEENLWIASEKGLVQLISEAFVNYETKGEGILEYVWSFVEDEKGRIWMSSYNHGLGYFENDKFTRVEIDENLEKGSGLLYYGAIKRSNGDLLFPCQKGVLVYDGHHFKKLKNSGDHPVLYLYEDEKLDLLFIGTFQGIIILDAKGNVQTIGKDQGLISNRYIIHIEKGNHGVYWLTSYDGFFKLNLNEKKVESFSQDNGVLPFRGATSTLLDSKNNLWIASTDGLYLKKNEENKFIAIGPEQIKGTLAFVTKMNEGELLIGLENGLAIFNLEKFYSSGIPSFYFLNYRNGFNGYNADQNAFLKDSKGDFWIASANQVTKFYPKKLKKPVHRSSIYFDGVYAASTEKGKDWEKVFPDSVKKRIFVPRDRNNIKINFVSPAFSNPDPTLFEYKLEGKEEEWSTPSASGNVVFSNLSGGNYNFKIRLFQKDSESKPKESIISFEVEQPFWNKLWFKLLVAFIMISMLYAIWSYQRLRSEKRSLSAEKIMLQEENEEEKLKNLKQTIEALKIKALHSQMNIHFLANSLNAIQSLIYNNEKDAAAQNLKDLSILMRLFLEATSKTDITIEEELQFIKLYIQFEKLRFEDKFDYEIEVGEDLETDMTMPPMLLQPFVENAINHGLIPKENGKGFLKIKIENFEDGILCHIIDNGIGRKKAASLKSNRPEVHQSRGLKIVKERSDAISKTNDYSIKIDITDLKNEKGLEEGTKIKIQIS